MNASLFEWVFIGNRLGIKSLFFYAALGIGGVWVTFLLSGIHATIAAVLAAFYDSSRCED